MHTSSAPSARQASKIRRLNSVREAHCFRSTTVVGTLILLSVTVIVPAYNAEATIGACLDAARGAGPFEIIVVNDGSTDQTPAIAKSYGARILKTSGRLGPAAGDWQ